MSNNSAPVRRRKWAFEKGKNSGTLLFAALTTAAFTLLLPGLFRYEYHSTHLKQQSSVLSAIDPALNRELFKEIERRDPARTYGVTGGSFTALVSEKDYQVDLSVDLTENIPEYPSTIPVAEISVPDFPVSGSYGEYLPSADRRKNSWMKPMVKVFSSDGRLHILKNLSELTGNITSRESVVRISGTGLLCRGETIRSSGDRKVDRMAEQIIKGAGLPPDIYIISWKTGGAEK